MARLAARHHLLRPLRRSALRRKLKKVLTDLATAVILVLMTVIIFVGVIGPGCDVYRQGGQPVWEERIGP